MIPFTLSKYGFTVCLSSNAGGVAGGYQDRARLRRHPAGISVGLVTTSTGESDFVLLAAPSFGQAAGGVYPGAANSLAYVSPIVMSELQYDPAQPTAAETAAGYTDGDDFEFLELYNRSNTTQTLSNYYMGSGVGFSFGWVPDGTVQRIARPWRAAPRRPGPPTALAAGTYTVYADFSLTDPNGNTRSVDAAAQYTITYPGGSTTVTADQGTAVNGQLDLGPITTTGPGQVQVQLMRQSTAAPSQWTLANQVEFVSTGVDLKVGSPALTSFATTSGITTLAPGAYVVLVSDYAAFEFRYGAGHPGGRPVHGPPEQRRGDDESRSVRRRRSGHGIHSELRGGPRQVQQRRPVAHASGRQRAGPDPRPRGRLRQRSLELDGQRRRPAARPARPTWSWIPCRPPFPRAWPARHR